MNGLKLVADNVLANQVPAASLIMCESTYQKNRICNLWLWVYCIDFVENKLYFAQSDGSFLIKICTDWLAEKSQVTLHDNGSAVNSKFKWTVWKLWLIMYRHIRWWLPDFIHVDWLKINPKWYFMIKSLLYQFLEHRKNGFDVLADNVSIGQSDGSCLINYYLIDLQSILKRDFLF